MSQFWQALMRFMGPKLLVSSASHPQTSGLTERVKQTIEQILRGVVNADHTDWDEHLDTVKYAYNNFSQASTGHLPAYLNYGEHPNTPIQTTLESYAEKKVSWTVFLVQNAIERAKFNTLAAQRCCQQRQKRSVDQHSRESEVM